VVVAGTETGPGGAGDHRAGKPESHTMLMNSRTEVVQIYRVLQYAQLQCLPGWLADL